MLDWVPIVLYILFILGFIGAVFDIDWIMKLTRADRRYGRKFARIYWGVFGGLGLVAITIVMIQAYF